MLKQLYELLNITSPVALTITREELKKYKSHKEIIEALNTLDYVSYAEEIQ